MSRSCNKQKESFIFATNFLKIVEININLEAI